MMIVRTQKLPGDIELIGNGHRRDIHRYTGVVSRSPKPLTHAGKISRFLITREKANG